MVHRTIGGNASGVKHCNEGVYRSELVLKWEFWKICAGLKVHASCGKCWRGPQRLRSFAQKGNTFPQKILIWEGSAHARWNVVVHKCANSSCENAFVYFRSGRLFQFPVREKRAVESFWLCGQCARDLTLRWSDASGVVLAPKSHWQPAMSD